MKLKNIDWESYPKKLIFQKNCTEPLEGADCFEIGSSRVVQTDFGSYRENEAIDHRRFGYKYYVNNLDKPHLMKVIYPDDKKRFIIVQDCIGYDITTGIITNSDPKDRSGAFKTAWNIFWPRALDQCVVISSWTGGEPSAAAEIAVYELDSLSEADISDINDSDSSYPKRTIGVQYEDPCNIGGSEGTMEFNSWLERHIQYMKMTGQDRLVYPVNWYHGPLFPVKSQPNERFNVLISPDRRLYSRAAYSAPDWPEHLMRRFDEEKLKFTPSFTLLRLGNLMKNMNNDLDSIKNGADTYNNINYKGQVQSSVNDWTAEYNVLNFKNIVSGKPFEFAYGEKRTSDFAAPIFNPLHPETRRQIKEYLNETVNKYAGHSCFEGICINMWHGTILWYASLYSGYDDYSFNLFENERGIKSGIEKLEPNRFEKRYAFVKDGCLEEFISWRCEKIAEFIKELRDMLRSVRPDLTLTINVWNETSSFGYLPGCDGSPAVGNENAQYANRYSNYEMYRRGGLDLDMLKGEAGICVSVERDYARDAGNRSCEALEGSSMLTDFSYLDDRLYEKLGKLENTNGFGFNCWVEAWGKHVKFPCEENDHNLDLIYSMPDYKADFVSMENCLYDDDPDRKYFYDFQYRVTSPFPTEPYFLEYMTADIALHDALSVTAGGLYLDKVHAPVQLELSREYRKLPAVKFNTLALDPVVLRYFTESNKTWVYILNREPYETAVSFNAGDDKIVHILPPFMLKVFTFDGEFVPSDLVLNIPSDAVAEYKKKAEYACETLDRFADKVANTQKIKEEIISALKNEHYSRLRHLLSCYTVKKCINLNKEK